MVSAFRRPAEVEHAVAGDAVGVRRPCPCHGRSRFRRTGPRCRDRIEALPPEVRGVEADRRPLAHLLREHREGLRVADRRPRVQLEQIRTSRPRASRRPRGRASRERSRSAAASPTGPPCRAAMRRRRTPPMRVPAAGHPSPRCGSQPSTVRQAQRVAQRRVHARRRVAPRVRRVADAFSAASSTPAPASWRVRCARAAVPQERRAVGVWRRRVPLTRTPRRADRRWCTRPARRRARDARGRGQKGRGARWHWNRTSVDAPSTASNRPMIANWCQASHLLRFFLRCNRPLSALDAVPRATVALH